MSEHECRLPSCQQSVSSPKRLTCSEPHHLLLMAARYSSLHPGIPAPPALSPHFCAFPSCSLPPFLPGHDCCSRNHYLDWSKMLHQSLSHKQICKLPGCFRHVFVSLRDDRAHEFCGWTHCQEFHIRSAHSVAETIGQLEHSVASLIESLKDYARSKVNPLGNVLVDEDFFDKHPWEVLNRPEVKSCWLIARCKFKVRDNSKRELITKGGFHWKQSGKPIMYSEVSRKYFTYMRLRGKKRGRDEIQGIKYTMIEYAIQNAGNNEEKNYCLVKVCQGDAEGLVQNDKDATLDILVHTVAGERGHTGPPEADVVVSSNIEGDTEVLVQSNKDATHDILVHTVADRRVHTGSPEAERLVGSSRETVKNPGFEDVPSPFDFDCSPALSSDLWGSLGSL